MSIDKSSIKNIDNDLRNKSLKETFKKNKKKISFYESIIGFTLYSLYNMLSPAIFLLYLPFVIFSPKNSIGNIFSELRERLFELNIKIPKNNIWIHASSIGEVKALKTFIELLKKKYPDTAIIITTSTSNGRNEALKFTDYAFLMKLDFYPIIKKLIKKIKPVKLIIIETELWPNLIKIASKNTDVYFINARISDKSYKRYIFIKPLIKYFLKDVKKIMAQSQEDMEKLASFYDKERIVDTGNIKYDNMEIPQIKEEVKKLKETIKDKIIVFGSTHIEEEEIIIKTYQLIIQEIPVFFIIAPRHINRAYQLEEILNRNKIPYLKYSQIKDKKETVSDLKILILDEIGLLNSFYYISNITYVGGTLNKIGGHNLLEPAQFSKPVLFGPYYQNAKKAAKVLLDYRGGFIVKDEYDLKSRIKFLLSDKKKCLEAGNNSNLALKSLQGAAEKSIKELK